MWSLIDMFRRRSSLSRCPVKKNKSKTRPRYQPLLEMLEEREVMSSYSITQNFNASAVGSGRTMWFNSEISGVTGVGTYPATIQVTSQTISVKDNGVTTNYTSVPNAEIILTPGATSASTTYNTSSSMWVSNDPSSLGGNLFVSGFALSLPSGLHGSDTVTWSATFTTDTSGISFKWGWGAAAYSSFSTTYAALGVKPCDDPKASSAKNSDKAGSPESYKSFVASGGTGTGGSNYAGNLSPNSNIAPTYVPTYVSLAGTAYNDANDNGVMDGSDTGISGITVNLTGTTTGGASVTATTTTSATGTYSFTTDSNGNRLLAGTYQITEITPTGYYQGAATVGTAAGTAVSANTISGITLAVGASATGYNFGQVNPFTPLTSPYPYASGNPLTNVAFNESEIMAGASVNLATNTFDIFYTDEHAMTLGVSSVTVKASNGKTTTTNYTVSAMNDGNVGAITNPQVGDTILTGDQAAVDPSGRALFPSLYVTDITSNPSATSGDWQNGGTPIAPTAIYGAWKSYGITVDHTTSPATVTLTGGNDPTANGWTLPAGADPVPASVASNNAGYGTEVQWSLSSLYNSGQLIPGHNYRLYFIVHDGDQNKTGGDVGQALYDFTYEGPATIAGTVYTDVSGNGVQNSSDTGLGNVGLTLTGTSASGQQITATTTTAANGSYTFTTDTNGNVLRGGTYTITETVPTGDLAGGSAVGTINGTTDGTATSGTVIGSIVIADGQNGINYNFGVVQPVSISGTVYQDNHMSGALTSDDPGVGGVTMTLTGTNGLGQSITATTTTAANGTYSFTTDSNGNALRPGTYQVAETQPTRYNAGTDTVGTVNGTSDGALLVGNMIGSILLTSGQNGINYNFGNLPYTYITGVVYDDINGDGQQEASEPVLSGWTVQLYTETNGVLSGSPVQTTTSGALGTYAFSNVSGLPSGTTYVIAEVVPANWAETAPSSATSGTTLLSSGVRAYVYPVSNGNVLLTNGSVNTPISGTGTLKYVSNNAGVSGQVSANDGAGDSMSNVSTSFDQLNVTFTPASGSALSFYSYCIDLFHDVSVGQSASVYVQSDENTAFVNGARMAYIYQEYGLQNLSSNPAQAAAVQLALWDLSLNNHNPISFAKDADGSYSSGDESVYSITFNSTSDANSVAPLVNQYLQASVGATTQGGWLNAAANGTASNRGQSMPFPGPWYNFGNTQPVTVSGTVYQDLNTNGVFNTGEPGVAGVTMTLTGTNSLNQSITATTTTNSSGVYSFTTDSNGNPLLPGTYQVAESTPSGYLQGTNAVGTVNGTTDGSLLTGNKIGSIALTANQAAINYNFGWIPPVTVAGTVYLDANANGTFDSGESGVSGVTLTLSGTNYLNQSVTVTTTTGSGGTYSFTTDASGHLLAPGTYSITETLPTGDIAGSSTVGTVNGSADGTATSGTVISAIGMAAGKNGINYYFGVFKPTSISGTVYQDINANGAFDSGEPGVSGVTLTLTGTNGLGQSITATTTTGSSGVYSFTTDSNGNLLKPGTYQITESTPSGYLQGTNSIGTVNGSSDGVLVSTNAIGSILVSSNQSGSNYNFGWIPPATVAGTVYLDANANGTLDSGETGISGATITLTGTTYSGQSVSESTTTGTGGTYSFTTDGSGHLLAPGTYQVAETPLTTYLQGLNSVGTVNGTADGSLVPVDTIGSIVLKGNQNGINYNFGWVQAVTMAGLVYNDPNGVGTLQSGDAPMAGVTMTLSGTNILGTAVTATTTTASDGTYSFTKDSNGNQLAPGTYTITETVPTGYVGVAANVGTVGGVFDGTQASPTVISSIAMASGKSGINYDFGVSLPASVSGFVYGDANADKIFDNGDDAVLGQTVTLTGTDMHGNHVSLTTTTNSNGFYIFTGLLPGTYSITVATPTGVYSPEVANVGTISGTKVGVANAATELEIDQVQLTWSNVGINYDFGFSQFIVA